MKFRKGFVSNSSSSSFVCEVCGEIESGYDCSLNDFAMAMCEHEHTFHKSHAEKDFYDAPIFTKYEYIKKYWQKILDYSKENLAEYQAKNEGKGVSDWEKDNLETNPNYFQKIIDDIKKRITVQEANLEELAEDYANMSEDEFSDKYEDDFADIVSEEGVPEEYCPVCALLKKAEQDEEYAEYQRLKEKFSYIQNIEE